VAGERQGHYGKVAIVTGASRGVGVGIADNETFIRAMGVSDEGISVLWRR
jgi:hypothetical protein